MSALVTLPPLAFEDVVAEQRAFTSPRDVFATIVAADELGADGMRDRVVQE